MRDLAYRRFAEARGRLHQESSLARNDCIQSAPLVLYKRGSGEALMFAVHIWREWRVYDRFDPGRYTGTVASLPARPRLNGAQRPV